jgi:hypothetical protein
MASLQNLLPARRAVAGCIIGWVGDKGQKTSVRKLLVDEEPLVRLRASQGLLAGKDVASIPVLVELLETSRLDLAWLRLRFLRPSRSFTCCQIFASTIASCSPAWDSFLYLTLPR